MAFRYACDNYVASTGTHDLSGYATNDPELEAQGALECCKLEFYRRVAVPYEQAKCQLNGDVYANE